MSKTAEQLLEESLKSMSRLVDRPEDKKERQSLTKTLYMAGKAINYEVKLSDEMTDLDMLVAHTNLIWAYSNTNAPGLDRPLAGANYFHKLKDIYYTEWYGRLDPNKKPAYRSMVRTAFFGGITTFAPLANLNLATSDKNPRAGGQSPRALISANASAFVTSTLDSGNDQRTVHDAWMSWWGFTQIDQF